MVGGGLKVVVMTGASGGLGRAVLKALNDDYLICAICRDPSKLEAEIDDGVRAYCSNLERDGEAEGIAETILADVGTPWAIVNFLGGSSNAMSWKIGSDDFLNVLEQNVVTIHNVCRAFVPAMRAEKVSAVPAQRAPFEPTSLKSRGGRIINVSSIVAETGAAGAAHYAAAKAAVVGYTKSLALELAPKSITANVIAPGYFDAGLIRDVEPEHVSKIIERIPLGRLGSPDELGGIVRLLLSDESNYITGQVFHVNGGLR